MDLLTPSAPTGADGPQPRPTLRDEIFWLVPITLTLLGMVIFLFLNRGIGPDIAAILTLPVEAAGVIVAILGARGVSLARDPRRPRAPGRKRWWVAAVLSVLLAGLSVVVYRKHREPDPYAYLSGTIRIGYVEPGYPGWSTGANTGGQGFDLSVANAILDYFPRATGIEWVPLDSLEHRLEALEGPWGPSRLAPVHLVINNLSITEARRQRIDFAGPYYRDEEGFATPDRTARSIHDIRKVCVPKGSTSEDRLKKLGIRVVVDISVQACFQRFFSGQEAGLSVSTDISILQAYVAAQPAEKRREVPHFVPVGGEQYGIGLPNNRPKLCERVNEALQKFLDINWGIEFDQTLGRLGVNRTLSGGGSRQPTELAPCEPAGSWLK
ncbi:hypothetical protein GCM10010123_10120 [Pilimelia anulata]|uniref:Solute-binding protein family 3/N-terminal domain-containing protein n=1 Tax=Pilimelia anulata TaxID=53371 RepID=A0A8J3FBC4_9ACTN|nr:transporter substrate-binding domain-containing protein [Pilimelia anulata]GGJ82422.1 hypothetical protein GCM10010123_10120 [Pilimelia anulata]